MSHHESDEVLRQRFKAALADDFGMRDDKAEIERRPELKEQLTRAQPMSEKYRVWDRLSLDLQARHKLIVFWGAVAGTTAVIFAVLQMAVTQDAVRNCPWLDEGVKKSLIAAHSKIWIVEGLVAIVALLLVTWGIVRALEKRHRMKRFQAEQLRFAKIFFLMESITKGFDAAAQDAHVQAAIHELERLSPATPAPSMSVIALREGASERTWLIEWIKRNNLLMHEHDPTDPTEQVTDAQRNALRDYYIEKRLEKQRAFFAHRARQHSKWEKRTRRIPPIMFFISVCAAILHLVLDAGLGAYHVIVERSAASATATTGETVEDAQQDGVEKDAVEKPAAKKPAGEKLTAVTGAAAAGADGEHEHSAAEHVLHFIIHSCLVVAVLFPIIGVFFRTVRGAFEFGRNENRYEALTNFLDHQKEVLLNPQNTAKDVWWYMQKVEDELADEHRGWMRLMIEAEWYG